MRFLAILVALGFTCAALVVGIYLGQSGAVPRIEDIGATELVWKLGTGQEAAYVLSHDESVTPALEIDALLQGAAAERFLPKTATTATTKRVAHMSIVRSDDASLRFLLARDRAPDATFPPPGYASRGTIDESGHVTSTFLPRDVQNLVHLYVGLPRRPVRVGDSWPIEVFLASVPGGGDRPTFQRRAEARLVAVEQQGGSRVAVIDTVAVEKYVDDTPDAGGSVKMAMVQRARFDVDKGILLDVVGNAVANSGAAPTVAGTYHVAPATP